MFIFEERLIWCLSIFVYLFVIFPHLPAFIWFLIMVGDYIQKLPIWLRYLVRSLRENLVAINVALIHNLLSRILVHRYHLSHMLCLYLIKSLIILLILNLIRVSIKGPRGCILILWIELMNYFLCPRSRLFHRWSIWNKRSYDEWTS